MLSLLSFIGFRYDHSAGHAVFVVISVLLFHFLVTGAILATCCWFFTNNYLREEALNSHVVEQRVEWLYAFDVHCNSFFPVFVLLYVVHYFLSPLLVAHGFVPELLSNLLFMVAASYYHYLNYLGYDVLPFLERTTLFLYPIGVVFVLSPILILTGFNPSRHAMNMYFSRVL
ncbi:UNC-50 family protein [Striga asiatica]|uniref:UNC-50 family protein n=1 Tax=Striga asiatica TaxID=4170 RepID=A0A5A7P843_STRAF|nr:UNC-50 family protein [Striga asiatica]